jgi:hypothetical protein
MLGFLLSDLMISITVLLLRCLILIACPLPFHPFHKNSEFLLFDFVVVGNLTLGPALGWARLLHHGATALTLNRVSSGPNFY